MSEHQTAEPGQDASLPPLGWPWSWVDPRRYASVPNIPEIVVLASTILSDIQTVMEGLLKRDEAVIPVYRYIICALPVDG